MEKNKKTRDQIIWPFNPNEIPRSIYILWGTSCFALSATGFLIGTILIGSGQPVASIIVFVFAFFMVGVGIYQIKQFMRKSELLKQNLF